MSVKTQQGLGPRRERVHKQRRLFLWSGGAGSGRGPEDPERQDACRSIKEGNGFMKLYKKIMSIIAGVEKIVISAVLVFVTAITFINVVVRKLTTSQFAWTEELVINLFVLLIMLGCALAAQEGSLISLSLIYDRLRTGAKKVFISIISVFNLVFWCILIKTGFDKVINQMGTGKHTSSLNWPEWVFTIFLPIGTIFLVLHTIEFFVDNVIGDGLTAGEEDGND